MFFLTDISRTVMRLLQLLSNFISFSEHVIDLIEHVNAKNEIPSFYIEMNFFLITSGGFFQYNLGVPSCLLLL
jgi:hypothetical protein